MRFEKGTFPPTGFARNADGDIVPDDDESWMAVACIEEIKKGRQIHAICEFFAFTETKTRSLFGRSDAYNVDFDRDARRSARALVKCGRVEFDQLNDLYSGVDQK